MVRGIDYLTGTSTVTSLEFSHRRGASVKITDAPFILILGNVINGSDSLYIPIHYDSSVSTSSLASNRQNIASAGLVADTAFAGAGVINSTTAAKGVVQIATQLQGASSTSLGSSGATVVIPASSATSTYNSATAALRVVVTQNNGKIDPNFVTSTFVNSSLTGTTTMATTTINGFNPYGLIANQFATSSAAMTATFQPRDYVKVILVASSTNTSTFSIDLNGDGGTNYLNRVNNLNNNTSYVAQANINPCGFITGTGTEFINMEIFNATSSNKVIQMRCNIYDGTSGTVLLSTTTETVWLGSKNKQVTTITLTSSNSTNRLDTAGSFIKVYGDTSNP
jgi:hypothetical protein